mgnify:CR=1 FL=1|tara:strand:+ start:32297 stop:33397 length:1101 start_codon:yes stop_codon:yes gene_type:complete
MISYARLKLLALCLFWCLTSTAELPIGIYEGLLGNSGAALSDSTAPSMYNASLLARRKVGGYSYSGSTLETTTLSIDSEKSTSSTLVPGYMSSVMIGEFYNHELYVVPLLETQLNLDFVNSDASNTYSTNTILNLTSIRVGYSFAFRRFPFAFGFTAVSTEQKTDSISEANPISSDDLISVSKTESLAKSLDVAFTFSGHHQFGGYTFGYQYLSRAWRLTESADAELTTYLPGTASTLTKSTSSVNQTPPSSLSSELRIGQGFFSNGHEFTTDTFLSEDPEKQNSYDTYQSFGYRMVSKNEHQVLVGFRQKLGVGIKHFGQASYYSCGYSWKNRGNRSVVGLYYSIDESDNFSSSAGITFGSEYFF